SGFSWEGDVPDPAAEASFLKSKLDWRGLNENPLAIEFKTFYRRLIALSKWIRKERIFEIGWVKTSVVKEQKIYKICTEKPDTDFFICFSFCANIQKIRIESTFERAEVILASSVKSHLFKGEIEL